MEMMSIHAAGSVIRKGAVARGNGSKCEVCVGGDVKAGVRWHGPTTCSMLVHMEVDHFEEK